MSFLSNIFSTSEGKGRAFMLVKTVRKTQQSQTVANSKNNTIVHIPSSGSPSDAASKFIYRVCKTKTEKQCEKTKDGKVCKKKKIGESKRGPCSVIVNIIELETNPSGKAKQPPTPIPNAKVLKYRGRVKIIKKPVERNGKIVTYTRKAIVRSLN